MIDREFINFYWFLFISSQLNLSKFILEIFFLMYALEMGISLQILVINEFISLDNI